MVIIWGLFIRIASVWSFDKVNARLTVYKNSLLMNSAPWKNNRTLLKNTFFSNCFFVDGTVYYVRIVRCRRIIMKKTIRIFGICCLLLCGALFSGCAAGKVSAWREYKVYCGMSLKHGEVSEAAWQRFCDKHVSEAFPDGYTVLDATGYWRSAKERSKVILIVAPAAAREKVLSVARQYRKEFDQDAVLISSSEAETDVVSANGKVLK